MRIGFTGHQGLTSRTASLVASAITDKLADTDDLIGLCSLAEGRDQIFAQSILASGGALIVVVPCHGYESTFTSPTVLNAYRDLVATAKTVIQLDYPEPAEAAYWAAGKRIVSESDTMIAVWDGKPAGGLGGTADVVTFAHEQGTPVEVVWPAQAARG